MSILIFFYETQCFKTNSNGNKNTFLLQHKTYFPYISGASNQDVLQIKFVGFLSFAATLHCT